MMKETGLEMTGVVEGELDKAGGLKWDPPDQQNLYRLRTC